LKAILILCAALIAIGAVVLAGLKIVRATRLWPAALLIVTAPLEVYRSSSGAGLNVSLFRLALGAGFVALAVDVLRGRKKLTGAVAVPFLIYVALLVWQLASLAFVTPDHSLAYRFLGQYAGGLLAAFIITRYVERRDLPIVVGLVGVGAVLPLVAAAYRVFSVRHGGSGDLPGLSALPLDPTIEAARKSGSFLLDGTQRLNATFSDPNHFGFYISIVFLVLLGATGRSSFDRLSIKVTASYALIVLSCAIALIGTYSRSSWLLAAVGLVVMLVLIGPSLWTRTRAIAACIAGAIAMGAASPALISRLGTAEVGNAESTRVHEHTMSIALKLLAHHPITGVGLGDYGRHAGQPALVSSAHSTFLTVSAELGVVGLLLLLAAIGTTSFAAVRSVRREALRGRLLLAGLTAAFIGLAVANVLYEVWMDDFQWVLFGLLLAATAQYGIDPGELLPRRRHKSGSNAPTTSAADRVQVVT
jgi:hypothetical protein